MDKTTYDVIILGGGPVGLVLGSLLSQAHFSVVCLDRAPSSDYLNPQEGGRCLALSWGSLAIFDQLGLKKLLMEQGAPIQDIWVTQGGQKSALHYGSQNGGHPMGVNIEVSYLKQVLYEKARSFLHTSTLPVALIRAQEKGWVVQTEKGSSFKAPLIIGADGRHSWLREQLGFSVKRWFYGQQSLVATIYHTRPHQAQAYEHFLPQGPLALLPMQGQKSSLIWSSHPHTIETLLEEPAAGFINYLSTCFGNSLGELSLDPSISLDTPLYQTGAVTSYPLAGLYCPTPFQEGAVLMGDAAHAMHPVAGQGLNIGLKDAQKLAHFLSHDRLLGLEWWKELTLARYHQSRKIDVVSMLGLTHGLVKLFSQDLPLLNSFLSLGLGVVNRLPFLKNFLSRKAMGVYS